MDLSLNERKADRIVLIVCPSPPALAAHSQNLLTATRRRSTPHCPDEWASCNTAPRYGHNAPLCKDLGQQRTLMKRLQAENGRIASKSAQDSQSYIGTLQQELTSARDAAAAAAAEAEAERKASAEGRVAAAARHEELEAALAAAVQEATSSHRAAEEAVEALEQAEVRPQALLASGRQPAVCWIASEINSPDKPGIVGLNLQSVQQRRPPERAG
jgi:hypothetical protein